MQSQPHAHTSGATRSWLGWPAYLSARDIEVVVDDLGRVAITRSDAKQLFAERREAEARAAELRAQQEQALAERSRQMLAQLPRGVPWYKAVGLSAAGGDDAGRARQQAALRAPAVAG